MVRLLTFWLMALLMISQAVFPLSVHADQLLERSLKLSDNRASVPSVWEFGFQFQVPDSVALLSFQVCSNDPLPDRPCDIPAGLDLQSAVLQQQTGTTGFSISASTTANRLILQRNGSAATVGRSTYRFSNVMNPTTNGSYFVRVQTYQTSYVSTNANNYGGIAFNIANNVSITATVPPYLLFCVGITVAGFDCENVTGDYVDFGEFSSRQASQGTTQMLAATNAKDGYTIFVNGPTLTSGNNIIPSLVGSDISRPGTSQFGINLRANSSPQGGQDVNGAGSGLPTNGYNQINFYRYNSGDVVASSPAPDLARKYTTTYLVNIAKAQQPGVYVSTITYVALGSF